MIRLLVVVAGKPCEAVNSRIDDMAFLASRGSKTNEFGGTGDLACQFKLPGFLKLGVVFHPRPAFDIGVRGRWFGSDRVQLRFPDVTCHEYGRTLERSASICGFIPGPAQPLGIISYRKTDVFPVLGLGRNAAGLAIWELN